MSMLEKTFQPQDIESRHYKEWENSGHFACDPNSKDVPFTIMMPPPNVTGSLHMGHALNGTLHDILVRWNRMKGKDTLWLPGLDHAGIATQMVVERQLAEKQIRRGRDLNREQFVEKVWEWKEESGGTIVGQQKRLGTTPDWGRARFTMDDGLSEAVRKVFVTLYKDGLIYKDKRLVNWDPKLKTAVSDLEVEMIEGKGKLWHIDYSVEGDEARTISVATTRPETLLGDTAVAVHPEDDRYKDLIGKMVSVPICHRLIPVVADEHADPDKGSGAVKITPAHDFDDFTVGQRHDLPMINIFNDDATLNENVPEEYQGMDRFEARKKILAELEELEKLSKIEKIKHAIPYDEKSKTTVLEPYLTDQWYVDAKTLAQPALEAVRTGKTEFVPKQWENTYFNWLENIQPWCISRQLWWGHQIPAWYDAEGNVYVADNEQEAQAQAGEGVQLTRDDDVLDTWFSSALWPFSTLGWPDKTPELEKYYPGDVLITGFDIIFFWVARMMMMGIYFMEDVPFKTVYIHALVRDSKGQKMSKSKGNVIDPLDLIDQFGADALRFCLTAMAAQGRDVRLSEDRVAGYRNFATKLWNASRYCEMNNCTSHEGFDPAKTELPLNKWIINAVKSCQEDIDKALENYRFNDAASTIYQFTWGTFCDWYLEFTKPILNGDENAAQAEVRQTTAWVLNQILKLLNPFMPFITEELNEQLGFKEEGKWIFSSEWPDYGSELEDDWAVKQIEWVIKIITEIRSVRADMNVPAKAEINMLVKDACDMTKQGFETYGDLIKKMARLSAIDYTDEAPKGSIQAVVDRITLVLPIADLIDLDKERERLQKEIAKLDSDINKISKQLDNQSFVANAPAEVVEEQKNRRAESETTKEKLVQALEQLNVA